MKKTLKRIAPLRLGIVLAALYAFLSLIFIPVMILSIALGANSGGAGSTLVGIAGAIAMALFYPVIGFLTGVIGAALYNFIVPWTGGIEVEIE